MSSNPYDSRTSTNGEVAKPRGDRNIIHIAVLGFTFLLTLLLALLNSVGEQLGAFSFTLSVTAAAVVSQLPGIAVGFLLTRSSSRTLIVFLFPAYFIAATGMLAYLAYAFNGKADSLNSAAHMHIIMFPMLHCFIAFVSYTTAAGVLGIVSLVAPKR